MVRRCDPSDDRGGALVKPDQGEIWWAEAEDKRRPVLVVSRPGAAEWLTWLVVAPVTRTVRHLATEVALGSPNGLAEDCAASFDNLQPIRSTFLTERVGRLTTHQSGEICRALGAMADC